MAREQKDVLLQPAPKEPPWRTSRRIGIHTSTAGGVETAAERAYRLGCSAFQMFSSSPRQWRPYELSSAQCETMNHLRQKYDLKPLVIHANYLINMASITEQFYRKAIEALHGEMLRGLNLGAEYLVLHPGSFRGMTRQQGLVRAAEGIAQAIEPLAGKLKAGGLTLLIENTAGSEFSLGGSFEQVAELIAMLKSILPVAACIDTCHVHVAGYDIVSTEGYDQTVQHLDDTIGLENVPVWHCNDAKAARGSRLDRHQHIGKGTLGPEPFRRLLNDPRTQHAAFIAETPIDEPGDDMRNVEALKKLVNEAAPTKKLRQSRRALPRRGT